MSVEAMMSAIQQGERGKAEVLLANQPELRAARDPAGVSLLMQALYHRQAEIASLLATGRQLDLHEAVSIGRLDRVSELLDAHPTSISDRSPDGFTPLHYAAFFGQPATAKLLLEHCAEVSVAAENPMKVHPLHSAAASNDTAICRQLLEAGADADAQQHGGYTALMSAAMHGNTELIELLLDYGASRTLESDEGKTALDFAREKEQEGAAKLLME